MSRFVQKLRRSVGGGSSNNGAKTHRHSLIEHDYMESYDDKHADCEMTAKETLQYNEYDNLHGTASVNLQKNNKLSSIENISAPNVPLAKTIRMALTRRLTERNINVNEPVVCDENNNQCSKGHNYCELYSKDKQTIGIVEVTAKSRLIKQSSADEQPKEKRKSTFERLSFFRSSNNETDMKKAKKLDAKQKTHSYEQEYYEIHNVQAKDQICMLDNSEAEEDDDADVLPQQSDRRAGNSLHASKSNLYHMKAEAPLEVPFLDMADGVEIDEAVLANAASSQSLTDLRELATFLSQADAFHWYLNLLFETATKCIENDQTLGVADKSRRVNIGTAHQLYARNFYGIRIVASSQLKHALADTHPCVVALACLLSSDAVRIVESHACTCDSYVYLFQTKIKFCAWKCKFYIILKRPNRSSIDRLTLIEEITNCNKLIQDKSIN